MGEWPAGHALCQDGGPHGGVVVITALKEDRILAQARALGENAVLLRKPFDLSELESAVSTLLPPKPAS